MLKALRLIVDIVTNRTPEPAPRGLVRLAAPAAKPALRIAKPAVPAVPRQSVDPRRFTGTEGVGAWILQVDDPARACEFAQANRDRRFSAAGATPLPAPGCCRGDCACMYKAQPEHRQGPRRVAAERREQVRFETKKVDRRKNSGRRIEDVWDRKRV
jgi:hypothetical protein